MQSLDSSLKSVERLDIAVWRNGRLAILPTASFLPLLDECLCHQSFSNYESRNRSWINNVGIFFMVLVLYVQPKRPRMVVRKPVSLGTFRHRIRVSRGVREQISKLKASCLLNSIPFVILGDSTRQLVC